MHLAIDIICLKSNLGDFWFTVSAKKLSELRMLTKISLARKRKTKMNVHELNEIWSLIEQGEVQQAFSQMVHIHERINAAHEQYSAQEKANFYQIFGELLFKFNQYDRAIDMFRISQAFEFSEEIDQFIQQGFIQPNLLEFEANYKANTARLKNQASVVDFHELPYHLIPTEVENKYYLYHKKNRKIVESFALLEKNEHAERVWNKVDLVASFLMIDKYELGNIRSDLKSTAREGEECFVVFEEYAKFLSTLQGGIVDELDRITAFASYQELKEFFENSSGYLPRNVISYCGDTQKAESYLTHLHRRRLKVQHRNLDHVILSICIPSYNRGYRALETVINSLNTVYDYELEIVVSNNGTRNSTAPFYEEIKNYEDSRITYSEFDENKGFYANILNVCRIASGRFILLMSDEDLVDLQILEKIMAFLYAKPEVALLKASTTQQSRFETKMAQAGEEALKTFMLTSNYMSGMILNNQISKEKKMFEQVDALYKNNNLTAGYYPHMCWEMIMCQYGEVHSSVLPLVREGAAEEMAEEDVIKAKDSTRVPTYATIGSRLEQHKGFFDLMLNMEISVDERVLQDMYIVLCSKTFWLMRVSIANYYHNFSSRAELEQILLDTYKHCVDASYMENMQKPSEVVNQLDRIYRSYAEWIKRY
ncbi:hypothetical protein B9G55_10135 [Saccharibacillus sp. O16]|nr:hypothetical protein B9G55_10135 [Saccharibacillus sp. O16]